MDWSGGFKISAGERVQFLQAQLFPVCTITAQGFLGSFLSKSLKTNQLEVNTDERTLRTVARLKEPRDLFALPKDRDHDCPQQAARWPTECQVLEERVHHIEYLPEVSEFYYQPTGNELRPRPVGEENGVVVFNYNPVSAVNYARHSDDDSDSSSESRSPSPKSKANRFSKHFQYRRSSSNSVDEDEDDYDEEIAHTKFVEDRSRSPILVPQIRSSKIAYPQRVPSPKRLAEIAPHPPPARCNIREIPNITPVHFSGDQPHDDNNNNNNKKEEPPSPQFSRSSVGGSRLLSNAHPCSGTGDCRDLIFESRFESGNLAKAVKITSTYYELYLRPDLYTNRHKQWFYFRVTNTKRNVLYRLSIVNLVKSDSLYNEGMRPLMYSTFNARSKGEGWRRCGDNISYYKNEEEGATADDDDENGSYTLTFNIQFPYDADTVYFAHSYPYTYSDLQDYLMDIQKHPVKSKFCKLRLLCRSLAGNNVYYLTVTAPTFDEDLNKRKKAIVVSARVHPGETPASWMMKGLMDFITGDSRAAKQLRHRFIFKLIPMLNPDGVIVGNTRSSLTGKDLNRQYRTVIRETYPSIWYTKAMIKRLIDDCGVAMYCDMHAHSRRHNVFIYGCENKRTPEKKLTEQVFPLMVHKNCADKFSFESCKFKIQRSKEGTGRIVIWMLGVTNSYTMEASFGGSTMGSRNRTHFNTTDYEHMGRSFCETLLDYYDENPSKERLRNKIIDRLNKEGSSADEPLNIQLSDYSSDEGDTSSSSSDNEGKDLSQSDYEGPCCQPLKVPPCSPAYDGGKKIKIKTRTKGKSQSQKRPKRQPQKERTSLDLPTTDPGSDIQFSTDDEYYIDGYGTIPRARKTLLQSELQRKYLTECTNNQKMPPELIVTPAKNPPQSSRSVEREEIKRTVISPAITEFPPIGSGARRTNSWHNLNKCGPKTKIQTVNPLMRSDNPDNLQIKLNLKKQIWTGVNPDDRTRPLSWGIPPIMMKKKAPKDDHEALLTACSQRLAAWQETESGPSSAKPKNKMMINLIAPEVSEKVPRPRKTPSSKALLKPEPTPTEPKEKKKRNPLSKIAETTQILTKMAKTKGRTSMPQRKLSSCNTALTGGLSIIQPLAPLKGHKFKTGGIVATAVQPIKKKKSRCSVPSLKIEKSESEIEKSYVHKKVKIKSKKKKSKIS